MSSPRHMAAATVPAPVPPGAGGAASPVRSRLPAVAWKVLLAGAAIRELFSFWTGHPYDFEIWIRTASAVAHGHNPYAFWPAVPGVSIAYLNTTLPSAAYLPFWPLLEGGLYRIWEFVGGGNRFVLYFLLKQPSIFGDLATAYLLYRVALQWTGRISTAVAALSFWSFFPYAIVISSIWGQFDSIVVAIVLASFLARGALARNALYGWGIFVKWITAIYLPLELFAERGARRASILLALAIPTVATVLTFLALGWGFQSVLAASVSQSHGGGVGENWVGILTSAPVNPVVSAVPHLDAVLGYLWVPALILAGWVAARWYSPDHPEGALRAMLFVTTVFLLFRWGLYEQYLLYLFALIALDFLVFHPQRRDLFRWVNVLSWAFLLVNNDYGIRFLAPLSPSVTAFTDALDASPLYGTVRVYALIGLCAIITLVLVWLVVTYYRDDPAPEPWWRILRPTRSPTSSPDIT
jgi:hypothetical protein